MASAARAQSVWSSVDVGAVGSAGASTSTGAGAFTITGDGADIWNAADAFHFVYTTLTGDGSIVARVATVQDVNNWTKAGVMMRESLASGSKHAMMLVSAAKGLALQSRLSTGGTSVSSTPIAGFAPMWVKLTRAGNTITGLRSSDGVTWTAVGSETVTMASTIDVGLAVTSHLLGTPATATFDSTVVTPAVSGAPTTETLVFFRHGEKPAGGYGQLTCQGLQRALALPNVLAQRYGTPNSLFAPNPLPPIADASGSFDYVRPLATIEPTAIGLGMPVNAQYGYDNIAGLQTELLGSTYAAATVFVSWEHIELQTLVQNLMNAYGGGATVPAWPSTDFDSLYVVRLTRSASGITATFEHDFEGLNGLPTTCP
ncbi:MAG TPA: hypothetical protein VEU08_07015 [Vicinamibacterales bacterium]|nr:hypothetical protein [Vicinamibacterales bacterium]